MALEDESLRSEGVQQATGEELTTCPSSVSICDAVGPKPSGRSIADVAAHERTVRSCESIKIGTWNVRSMNQGKLDIVKNEMTRYNIRILGISELKWTGEGHFRSDEHTVYYSGNNQIRRHGVAFIVHNKVAKSIMEYRTINDRCIVLRIRAQPVNITLIQIYAPTADAEEDIVNEFYESVQQEVDKVSSYDLLVVMGDWNAKIGAAAELPVVGKYGLGKRNEAGDRMVEFCEANRLMISNTMFQQHSRRLYTWTAPNKLYKNQIDYICISQRWKSAISSVKTKPGADCGTDHQLLTGVIQVKLCKCPRQISPPKYDVENIAPEFKIHLNNRFAALASFEEDTTPEELWNEIKTTITNACAKHLKIKKNQQHKWLSQEAIQLAQKRKEAKTKNDTAAYSDYNRQFQRAARKDKEAYYSTMCNTMEEEMNKGHSRSAFATIKKLKSKFAPRTSALKLDDGSIVTDSDKVKQRWREYTKHLYGADLAKINYVSVNYDDEPDILRDEVEAAIKHLPRNKAPGVDGIQIELLQQSESAIDCITKLCRSIWKTKSWPKDWKKSVFIPLHKKGDRTECSNYRTIALIPHTSKVLLKIIQRRLEPYLESQLPENQAGFRKGRGTRDIISDVRRIMEKSKEHQKDVYMCFIDYSKAFDCVDYDRMWLTLRDMGIPEHLIVLLRNLYTNQEATVRTEHGVCKWFPIEKGVRQGCILSPYLFNLYAEQIIRNAGLYEDERGIKLGGRTINNLRYADDTTLLAESEDDLKQLLLKVEQRSLEMGLSLNINKTKIMTTNGSAKVWINNEEIETVNSFNLLGSTINDKATSVDDIKKRIALGKSAVNDLSRIFTDKNIQLRTKVRIVNSMVFPVMMYGCESWTVKKQDLRKVDAFEMWCWRRILQVPWTARRTNKSIIEEIQPDLCLQGKIMKLQLSYFGHIARRPHSLEHDMMFGYMDGKRKPGRPATRWTDTIKDITGISISNLKRNTQDRTAYRSTIYRVAMSRNTTRQ